MIRFGAAAEIENIVLFGPMAELALYGNNLEPAFPFDLVAPQLSWLPEYLSAADETASKGSSSKILPLIDTVLVFTRARTSAMYSRNDLPACRSLVRLLNAVLENVGGEALHHRLELVRRGNGLFFITCKNSPRFNWKTHLTHIDIGRNLDYSASGHIFLRPFPPRGLNQFIERTSMQRLFSEYVLLETLQDNTLNEELSRFNAAKEALFNDVMRRLGLPYRFKWVLSTPSRAESAKSVIASLIPPSQEWWEDNCVFADGNGIPGLASSLRYCSLLSKFEKYWPVIQHMYFFLTKYETMSYVTPDREILFPGTLAGGKEVICRWSTCA